MYCGAGCIGTEVRRKEWVGKQVGASSVARGLHDRCKSENEDSDINGQGTLDDN
jgi:hypothetical protein